MIIWADLSTEEKESLLEVEVDLSYADLRCADLSGCDLRGANLKYANLRRADLKDAHLRGATLENAYLGEADLSNADLSNADLRYAILNHANLYEANLYEANLLHAGLPSPAVVLSAEWGDVSDELCLDLMRYDAFFHDDPAAFDKWAAGDIECPYDDKLYSRAANFKEKRELWKPGLPTSGFDLMVRCIQEKCADSDYHDLDRIICKDDTAGLNDRAYTPNEIKEIWKRVQKQLYDDSAPGVIRINDGYSDYVLRQILYYADEVIDGRRDNVSKAMLDGE